MSNFSRSSCRQWGAPLYLFGTTFAEKIRCIKQKWPKYLSAKISLCQYQEARALLASQGEGL